MKFFGLAGLVALAIAAPCAAQDLNTSRYARTVDLTKSPDADLRTGAAGSGVVVSAASDASSVALTFGRSWDTDDPYMQHSWSLKLSAPLDKATKEGNFLAGPALANSTSLELAYNRIVLPPSPADRLTAARTDALAKGRDACKLKAAATIPADVGDAQKTALEEAAKAKGKACETKYLKALVKDGDIDAVTAEKLINTDFAHGRTWIFNVTGNVGYGQFDYRDPTDFGDKSTDRTPYGASASIGFVPPRVAAYVGAGLEYSQDYVDATDRTLCPAPPVTGPQECFTGPFDRPKSKKVFDTFGVVRWQDQLGDGPNAMPYGVELKAAYDFENEVTGFGAKLYLVPDKDKALRGGLRLLWQTDDHDPTTKDKTFSIGVFVSSAFSIF